MLGMQFDIHTAITYTSAGHLRGKSDPRLSSGKHRPVTGTLETPNSNETYAFRSPSDAGNVNIALTSFFVFLYWNSTILQWPPFGFQPSLHHYTWPLSNNFSSGTVRLHAASDSMYLSRRLSTPIKDLIFLPCYASYFLGQAQKGRVHRTQLITIKTSPALVQPRLAGSSNIFDRFDYE